jgi:hypothetical protein
MKAIKTVAIHLANGVARVGDSHDERFLGPATPSGGIDN